jgi:hypothetical protein
LAALQKDLHMRRMQTDLLNNYDPVANERTVAVLKVHGELRA